VHGVGTVELMSLVEILGKGVVGVVSERIRCCRFVGAHEAVLGPVRGNEYTEQTVQLIVLSITSANEDAEKKSGNGRDALETRRLEDSPSTLLEPDSPKFNLSILPQFNLIIRPNSSSDSSLLSSSLWRNNRRL